MRGRDIAITIGAVLLVVLFLSLLGAGMMYPGMMGWGGFGFHPLWLVAMLLFWGLIIGGVVLLLVWLFQQGRPTGAETGPSGVRALDILRDRYARGEITREEYQQMRRDIEG